LLIVTGISVAWIASIFERENTIPAATASAEEEWLPVTCEEWMSRSSTYKIAWARESGQYMVDFARNEGREPDPVSLCMATKAEWLETERSRRCSEVKGSAAYSNTDYFGRMSNNVLLFACPAIQEWLSAQQN
jgi:hypothetical protein